MISTHLTPPTFNVTLLLINLDFIITLKKLYSTIVTHRKPTSWLGIECVSSRELRESRSLSMSSLPVILIRFSMSAILADVSMTRSCTRPHSAATGDTRGSAASISRNISASLRLGTHVREAEMCYVLCTFETFPWILRTSLLWCWPGQVARSEVCGVKQWAAGWRRPISMAPEIWECQ